MPIELFYNYRIHYYAIHSVTKEKNYITSILNIQFNYMYATLLFAMVVIVVGHLYDQR